jgi:alpha-1,2-mannosyltransferase
VGSCSGPQDLSRWERAGLILASVVVVAFGAMVVVRGAFLSTRRTDLGVFLRAAWAVRSGVDLYAVTDDKGLPYNYPPLLAILLTPFADPPRGVATIGTIPFGLKVGLWYVFSIAILIIAVHVLAKNLTDTLPGLAQRIGPARSRRWWGLRVLPVAACLPAIGQGLVLGQVNVLWLAVTCGMAVALLRGHSVRAGLWLAGAVCLKVLPIFLLLYPLWRRDLRCLGGLLLGLAIGLGVVPAVALGPARALASTQTWVEVMLLPAFGMGKDRTREAELMGITRTNNQALMPVLHKTLNLRLDRLTMPTQVAPGVRLAHWLIGAALTFATLLASGWRRPRSPVSDVLLLGILNINMLLLSPAGHNHYLLLLVLPAMGLLAADWGQDGPPALPMGLRIFLVVNPAVSILPMFESLRIVHDVGLAMYCAILLWLLGVLAMRRLRLPSPKQAFVHSLRPAA